MIISCNLAVCIYIYIYKTDSELLSWELLKIEPYHIRLNTGQISGLTSSILNYVILQSVGTKISCVCLHKI